MSIERKVSAGGVICALAMTTRRSETSLWPSSRIQNHSSTRASGCSSPIRVTHGVDQRQRLPPLGDRCCHARAKAIGEGTRDALLVAALIGCLNAGQEVP